MWLLRQRVTKEEEAEEKIEIVEKKGKCVRGFSNPKVPALQRRMLPT